MLYTYNRRHKNVNFVPMDFKSVVAEELGDTIVGLHDLCLRVLVSTDDHNGSILGEHHLKIALLRLMITSAALSLIS